MLVFEHIAAAAGNVVSLYWNPDDRDNMPSPNMNLTADNLEAYETYSSYCGVRANLGKTSGKWYIEFELLTLLQDGDVYICFGSDSALLNGGAASEEEIHFYWRSNSFISHKVNGDHTAIVQGDIIQAAFNIDTQSVWWARTENNWIGGGDPAAGTSPTADVTGALANYYPIYLSDNISTSEQRVKILGHAFNQNYAAPSGFTPWGD